MATEIASLYAKIGADVSGFVGKMGMVDSMLTKAGMGMAKTGGVMTAGVSMPLMGIGATMVKTAADFEKQANIMAVSARGAGASFDELRQAAIKVGADTHLVGINASQAAEGITNLAKMGLSASEIFGDLQGYLSGTAELGGALRAAADLAAASELDMARASDVVAIAMKTFGIDASHAEEVASNFVQAADASVATVSDLAAALENVGPTAAAFGWSLQDTNTALAILSERGIRGSEAGTALKSMMTNLMRPTKRVKGLLDALNVSLYDQQGHLKRLPDIIGELQGALSGLTEEERNQAIQVLAGTYGMKAMNTLLAEGAKGWNDMASQIKSATSVQAMAGARTKGFAAAMEQLQGSIEALLINAGTPLIENFLTPAVQKLTDLLTPLANSADGWGKWALMIGGVLVAAGPVVTALGMIAMTLGALLSPIGLVVVAIAGLAAAWATNFGGIRDKTASAWAVIRPILAQAWTWLGAHIPGALQTIRTTAMAVFTAVTGTIRSAMAVIAPTVQGALNAMRLWWTMHGESVMTIIRFAMSTVRTVVTTALTAIRTVVGVVLGAVRAIWAAHGKQIMAVVKAAWTSIKIIISTAMRVIGAVIDAVAAAIKGDWYSFGADLRKAWKLAWDGIVAVVKAMGPVLADLLISIGQNAVHAFEGIDWGSVGSAIIHGIAAGVRAAAGALASAAAAAARAALDAAKGALGIHSPSAVFEREVGRNIGLGMVRGIVGMADHVARAGEKLASAALPSVGGFGVGGLALATATAGGYRSGGGKVTVIEFHYEPTYSLATDEEARQALEPVIRDVLRVYG